MKIYKLGNSEGIQMEFRGDSDAKKGIRIGCIENMVRFAMIFDTEITPSYPFIILKGRTRVIFDENHRTGCM